MFRGSLKQRQMSEGSKARRQGGLTDIERKEKFTAVNVFDHPAFRFAIDFVARGVWNEGGCNPTLVEIFLHDIFLPKIRLSTSGSHPGILGHQYPLDEVFQNLSLLLGVLK